MIRTRLPLVIAVLLVAGIAAASAREDDARPAPDSGLIILPALLDLGSAPPQTGLHGRVWLVNTSSRPITITEARPTCGCTALPDREYPFDLAPGAAHPFDVTVRTPKKVGSKSPMIRFIPSWGAAETAMLRMESVAAPDSEPTSIATASPEPVLLVPVRPDLGTITAGATADGSAWLINGGTEPIRVESILVGCKCTDVVGFEPTTVAAGEALPVRYRITAPLKPAEHKTITLTARLADRAPVIATVSMRVEGSVSAARLD